MYNLLWRTVWGSYTCDSLCEALTLPYLLAVPSCLVIIITIKTFKSEDGCSQIHNLTNTHTYTISQIHTHTHAYTPFSHSFLHTVSHLFHTRIHTYTRSQIHNLTNTHTHIFLTAPTSPFHTPFSHTHTHAHTHMPFHTAPSSPRTLTSWCTAI